MQTILNQRDLVTEIGCAAAMVRGILANLQLRRLDLAPCVDGFLRQAHALLVASAEKQDAMPCRP